MIAFCLDRLGLDPAYLIGGEVPQLGGNAAAGEGWLVVEGDESDRSVAALRPQIAVLLNVDLDHHTTFGSRAEVAALFEEWLAHVPQVVRGEELEPVALELAVPGEHNRRNAAAALAALELAGVERADAERAIVEFRGVGTAARAQGRGGRCDRARQLRAPSRRARRRPGGRARRRPAASRSSSRTSTRGRCYLAHAFGAALAGADAVCVTDVYAAREEPLAGVSGKLIVDALARERPGMRIGWAPSVDQGARLVAAWARPGDTILTLGAGDVDAAADTILELLA